MAEALAGVINFNKPIRFQTTDPCLHENSISNMCLRNHYWLMIIFFLAQEMSRKIFHCIKPHVEGRVEDIRDDEVSWPHSI